MEAEIIQADKLLFREQRTLPPYVMYADGYTHQNLPDRLYRISDKRSNRFYGVRSCSDPARADEQAKQALADYLALTLRYNPGLELVRSGWLEGLHYWDNKGGGPLSERSCHGYVWTVFYLDFVAPAFLDHPLADEGDEEDEAERLDRPELLP